jgi:flagellar hook-length control protein FliK
MMPKSFKSTDRLLEPQPLRVPTGGEVASLSSEADPLGVSAEPGTTSLRASFATLMSMQDLGDETIGMAATPSVLTPPVNPDLPPVGEIAADRLTVGSPIDPAELNRSAVETQSASETGLAPAWPAPGVAFDLPIFLRVLPGSGPAVAVAAARDPAMADAVRRLPENLARAEARTAAKQAGVSDLPDFLVAAKAPTEAVSPSQGMIAAAPYSERPTVRDPAAAVRRGIVAMTGSEPVVTHRKTFDVGSRLDPAGLTDGATKPPHKGVAVDVATPNTSSAEVKPAALKALTMSPAHRALQDSIGAATPARQSVGERTDRPTRPVQVPAAALTVGGPMMIAEPPMLPVGLSAGAPEGAVLDGTAALRQPVGTEAWQDELSAQLSVMAEQGERSEAVMKLAPAELGELEIRIEVRGSEATLQFGAASLETRQALEQAQSRLREMMASEGIEVSEYSIFSDLSNKHESEPRSSKEQSSPHSFSQRISLGVAADLQDASGARRPVGMVDLYA